MHGHLTAIAVYALTEEASVQDKDNFYNQFSALISATPPHDQLVVLGDFNVCDPDLVSGQTGFESVVGLYGVGNVNDNTQIFRKMCSSRGLAILGSWFKPI